MLETGQTVSHLATLAQPVISESVKLFYEALLLLTAHYSEHS